MSEKKETQPKPKTFCYRKHCALPRSCRRAGKCVLRETDHENATKAGKALK